MAADQKRKAIKDVCEIMQFESWVRFYFVNEEDGALFVRVHDKACSRIEELHPTFYPLVEQMNNQEIDYEKSMATVCQFVVSTLDGKKFPGGMVQEVFDTPKFQEEMQLFNLWSQAHEAQLDETFMDFSKWREFFQEWKNSPEVKEYFRKMRKRAKPFAQDTTETIQ